MLMQDNSLFVPVADPNMCYARTQNQRLPMEQRLCGFDEVEKTYTEEEALLEASRCLKCPTHWCQRACPANVPVTDFIARVRARDYEGAYALISSASMLPEICSRVGPKEKQSQANCTRAIRSQAVGIGRLERFVVEQHYACGSESAQVAPNGKRVAVVGSGPSGLSAAQCLANLGISVTVLERADRVGGLLEYGLPNMKLAKGTLARKIEAMQAQGVVFQTNVQHIDVEALRKDYDAIILAIGTGNARMLRFAGDENVQGIYPAVDYLSAATRKLYHEDEEISAAGMHVIIVGGGDTGSDCVGTAIRQGCASVTQIEMMPQVTKRQHIHSPYPANPAERKFDASQEECIVRFCKDPHIYQSTVKAVQADENGNIRSVTIVSLSAQWQGARIVTQELPGTERTLPCQMLVIAAGFIGPEADTLSRFGVSAGARGNIATENYATDVAGIYACGDCRTGQSLVVKSMVDGLHCARKVAADLLGNA